MIGFLPLPTVVRELPTDVTGERRYLLSNGDIVERRPQVITIEARQPSETSLPPKEREMNRHERRAAAKRERSGR